MNTLLILGLKILFFTGNPTDSSGNRVRVNQVVTSGQSVTTWYPSSVVYYVPGKGSISQYNCTTLTMKSIAGSPGKINVSMKVAHVPFCPYKPLVYMKSGNYIRKITTKPYSPLFNF